MNLNEAARTATQQFIDAISPWDNAYKWPTLSFLAKRSDKGMTLLQGRLFLQVNEEGIPKKLVESRSVVAGNISLPELGLSYREFIDRVDSGQDLQTPIGKLRFPIDPKRGASGYFVPYHKEGSSNGSRLPVLTITGIERTDLVRRPEVDWELAAEDSPYESLDELLHEFSLGGYQGDFVVLEVIAHTVAFVDFQSKVVGDIAEPAMLLPQTADPKKAQINYRVLLHGKVVKRGCLVAEQLRWTLVDQRQHGVGKVSIPSGAVLQCFAEYAGHVHHKGWIGDPALFQNPRRAAFEEFDPSQAVLKDFLFEAQRDRKEARDFEVGVAWLLWMLGFGVAHAGATPRTSEAADILATTPLGHTAIVECTTSHLKAEFKLSKLVERAKTIRRKLDESGNSHLRVLPIIVTALGKDEVKADLDQARALGVAVVTREDLLSAVDQTVVQKNAEEIYAQAEASVLSKQTELGLPIK
ncbi:MAG: hypothetical protein HZC22_02560 [Rhodocyclales bacterium]|nr:hypothetical protein [Rhodocyclales bacterium]